MFGSRTIDASLGLPAEEALSTLSGGLLTKTLGSVRRVIQDRVDSGGSGKELLKHFDAAVEKLNGATLARIGKEHGGRNDSDSVSGGTFLAGQLRHVFAEVFREKHPVPTGLSMFPVNTSIGLGARSFTVRRLAQTGNARVHRTGDTNFGRTQISQDEQEFQVKHYVTSAVWDVFEEMAAQYASIDYARELAETARDVIERFASDKTWFGDAKFGIYGVLNYPWLNRVISGENFYGTPTDSRTVLAELNRLVNYRPHSTRLVFGPNSMVTSPRVADWINQTPMGTTSTINDRTIGEVFLAGNERVKKIQQAQELQDVAGDGSGIDAILLFRNDRMGIENYIPGGGIQALPLYATDIESRQIFWFPHGGVVMKDVANNLLVLVRAAEDASVIFRAT